jgi:tetrapyrrole methylase family protein / MazG family protein
MNETLNSLSRLIEITNTLMGDDGCPWDKVQTRESLKPYLLEETYEVLDALDTNDPKKIKDELGDLLYQILFHSKISSLKGEFDFQDVINNLSEKMVRRHPHVFKEVKINTPDQVVKQWEEIKKTEKGQGSQKSILDNIPKNLPSLMKAQKLQKKAAKEGFDWDQIDDVFSKLDEEVSEFKEAVLKKNNTDMQNEIGDIFFVISNIAKFYKIDAEEALRSTNNKFIKRFQYIEQKLEENGKALKDSSIEEMERYWQEAKKK